MAVFEPDRARIVLRIVYDGPGRAGKTTNVEQLARIFGTRPGDELQVHPAATGRTIFFDWFSFDGGVLDGQQLQVQVVTVPGHKSLEPRRAHILRGADVVVLVCDSAVSGQDSAREMLDSLREHLGKSAVHVPLLVQANKQDLPNAMLPHELGAALRLGPDVPVIGAQASAGIGVRETAVGAIRAAVRQMKQRTASEGLGALAGHAGTAEQLRAALQAIESLGAHRSGDDEARRAPPRPQADEGRVLYIRSAKRITPLAGHAPARPRTPPVSENMSEKPASERPARPKIPVSAMFIEPTPHVEPPDIPSPPAPSVRVPPPPVLAHADAPTALTEPFDPEEERAEPETPGGALSTVAPASLGDLRDRWPTEAQPRSEEPPDAAAPLQDADETAPASALDPTPEPSLAETRPTPGDAHEPPLAHVPEDSPPPGLPVEEPSSSGAAPLTHVPEDSHPPDLPVEKPSSSGTAPLAHVPEDSHPSDLPAQDNSAATLPLAHVPEDSRSPDSPAREASSAAVASVSPAPDRPVPQDISAAASPAHVPEDSHSADAPASSAPGPDNAAPAQPEAALAGGPSASEPPSSLPLADSATTAAPSRPEASREVRHDSAELTPSTTAQEDTPTHTAEAAATDRLSPLPVPEDSAPASSPAAEDAAPAPPAPGASAPASSSAAEGVATDVPEDSSKDPEPPPEDLAAPRPDLPPGHVWPVPAGRHVLERIAGGPLVRARLQGHAPSNMLYKTGSFCLRTRPEWRFADDERGRAALREHVRRAARLGPLLPADTAVALAVGDGEHVLWHIGPDLPALGADLRAAAEAERPARLVRLAFAYASALRLGAREGLALDLDPHAFAEQDGRWVYLGDRLGEPTPAAALIHALLRPPAGPLDAWLDALEQVLPAVLTRDDVAALGLEGALAGSEAAPEARLRAILECCA